MAIFYLKLNPCHPLPFQVGMAVFYLEINPCLPLPYQVGMAVSYPKIDPCHPLPFQVGMAVSNPKIKPCHPLPFQVGMAVFYPEARRGTTPSVAIASGPHVFIYRNLRPYYKFSLPELKVDEGEAAAWAAAASSGAMAGELRAHLADAREAGKALSQQSHELLAIDDAQAAQAFVEAHAGEPIVRR
jgi:hypothetical protein